MTTTINATTRIIEARRLHAAWFDTLDKQALQDMMDSVERQIKRTTNKSQRAKLKQQLSELKNAYKNAK